MAKTAGKLLQPILLCIIAISLVGCSVSNDPEIHHINGPTMGTWYNVKFQALTKQQTPSQVKAGIDQLLADINQKMSTYIDDSELSVFNAVPPSREMPLSEETLAVLTISQQVHRESQGAFDITIGPLVNLWGFGPKGNRESPPTNQEIAQAKNLLGADSLVLGESQALKLKPVTIDLSAVAKGYAVDRVSQYLESSGIDHYMVEVGGEIRVGKRKLSGDAWKIAIEEPTEFERSIQKVLALESISLATSGDYRNYFEKDGKRYSHTIDPRSGMPISHSLASVTVLHRYSAFADAYATAITVLGPKEGMALAEKLNLAVYMLVKSKSGFEVLQTKSFSSYVDPSSI
ncbi:MAG: FAD:protein FMN transferase [Pseudomonadales bacterium]|nr:FAD:protein FMN transferase [Pseudomonadales bacterium]